VLHKSPALALIPYRSWSENFVRSCELVAPALAQPENSFGKNSALKTPPWLRFRAISEAKHSKIRREFNNFHYPLLQSSRILTTYTWLSSAFHFWLALLTINTLSINNKNSVGSVGQRRDQKESNTPPPLLNFPTLVFFLFFLLLCLRPRPSPTLILWWSFLFFFPPPSPSSCCLIERGILAIKA
jgi:hypothetical protein